MSVLAARYCCLILSFFVLGGESLQWTSPPDDWAKFYLFEGQDLQVNWSYSLQSQEWLREVTWRLMPFPSNYHILAVLDGTDAQQPFHIRSFYWGKIRQVENAGIVLENLAHRSSQGIVQVRVETITGNKSCCPYLPSQVFWRHASYFIKGPAPTSRAQLSVNAEKAKRRSSFSSLYPATRQQEEDCVWCLEPWRRQPFVRQNSAATTAAAPAGQALVVLLLIHLSF